MSSGDAPGPEERLGSIGSDDIAALKAKASESLYFFSKGILGYKDMTPRVHKEFCASIEKEPLRGMWLMPRGHFKTTVKNISHPLWRLAKNPEQRILLAFESAVNAEKKLMEIKGHVQNNQLLRLVFPDLIPKDFNKAVWSKQEIVVPREGSYDAPSVDTAGIATKLVSRHYDLISCDDLVSEEAMYSPTIMKKACDFVDHMVGLLVNARESSIHVTGTRWAYHDVYSYIMEKYPEFKVFIRKAIVRNPESGEPEPFFPERYSMEIFQGIIERNPYQWSTQYANDPLDAEAMDFKADWQRYFEIKPGRMLSWEHGDMTKLLSLWDCNIYIHVDPSMGLSPESDYSGIVVVAVDDAKRAFVVDAIGIRLDPIKLAEKIIELTDLWAPKKVTIEKNAYQQSLRFYIQDEARRRSIYVPVEDFLAGSNKSKAARIRSALQPLFVAGRIRVRKGLTSLVDEYLKFGKSQDTHLMDALAQGPLFWKHALSERRQAHQQIMAEANKVDLGVTGYGM